MRFTNVPFAIAGLCALLTVLLAEPAWGHATIAPASVNAGSTGDVVFSVPNEKDNASTTKVQIYFPANSAIEKVNAATVPGWSSSVEGESNRVGSVTFVRAKTAPDISPNFTLTMTFPTTVDRMQFPVLQTYSDGEVVRWIDDVATGAPEPEHPAPVLQIAGASTTTTSTMVEDEITTGTTAVPPAPGAGDGGSRTGLYFLAFGGFVLLLVIMRGKMLERRRQ